MGLFSSWENTVKKTPHNVTTNNLLLYYHNNKRVDVGMLCLIDKRKNRPCITSSSWLTNNSSYSVFALLTIAYFNFCHSAENKR